MTIELRKLEIKKCNTIITGKQQKHLHYHVEKLINMNNVQVKKYYHQIKEEW